jgi:hypothetical protein
MMSRPPKHTYELVPRGEDSQPSDFPEGGSFREKRIWERHPVAVLIGGLSGIFFFALLLKLLYALQTVQAKIRAHADVVIVFLVPSA